MQEQDTTPTEQQAHTPGPMHRAWSNAPLRRYGVVIAKFYDEGEREIGFVYGQDDEAVANAELWMAAPQMLAALERFADPETYNPVGRSLPISEAIRMARAAIAAARGGQS